ncbi:MAG: hypothetical protein PHD36_09710 [Desulfotomaculaceae bacterium]|nr:hypothetical protein [Desulfotomaculaceae bacterium]
MMYKVNLLPPELQRDISIDVKKLVKRVAVSLVAITLLVGYGIFLYSFFLTKDEIVKTEKYLNELQVTVKEIGALKHQRQSNELSVQKFNDLIIKRMTWSYVLDDLSDNLPVDVWLKSINLVFIDPQVATLSFGQGAGQPETQVPQAQQAQEQVQAMQAQAGVGVAPGGQVYPAGQKGPLLPASPPVPNTLTVEGYSLTVPSIGIYINNLNKMPCFTSVTLNEVVEDEEIAAIKFKLTAMIREGGR